MKRLLLASEAKNPNTMDKINSLVNGLEGKSIAYIPTASNGDRAYGSWNQSSTYQLLSSMKLNLEVILLEDYRNSSIVEKLKGKDIIWMAGGFCGYLMYWLIRCELDKYLPELIENSLYVGSSAGAMVAGNSIEASEWGDDKEIGASNFPTLKLVDFDIYPHYEDNMFDQIKKSYTGKRMYLLKNEESILVEGNKITVFGEERLIP